MTKGFEARDVLAIIVMILGGAIVLIHGWRRWTGRLREWANPANPDLRSAILFGVSPLTMITSSVFVLAVVPFYVGVVLRVDVMVYSAWSIMGLGFISFLIVRFLRPGWSDPPWLRDYDWDEHNRRKRSNQLK